MNILDFIRNKPLRERLIKYRYGVDTWKNKKDECDKSIREMTNGHMYLDKRKIAKDGIYAVNAESFINRKIEEAQPFDPTKIMFLNKNTGKIEKVFAIEDLNARFFISDIMVDNIIHKMMEDCYDDIVIGIYNNVVKIAIKSDIIATDLNNDHVILGALRKMPTFNSIRSVGSERCYYYVSEHVIDDSKVQWFKRGTFNAFTKAISDCIDFPIKDQSEQSKLQPSTIYGEFGMNRTNIKKVLLVSKYFIAPPELHDFIVSLGYLSIQHVFIKSGTDREIFDERIIDFIESRSKSMFGCDKIYLGKPTSEFLIGFSGLIHLTEVDISRQWTVSSSNLDIPVITYIKYEITKNNYNKVCCTIRRIFK